MFRVACVVTGLLILAGMLGAASDTGWLDPTASSGDFKDPEKAYTDEGKGDAEGTDGQTHEFNGYSLSLPESVRVTGIEVRLDAKYKDFVGRFDVELSGDAGASWTSSGQTTGDLTTDEISHFLGSSVDTWGRSWDASEVTPASFVVRLTALSPSGGKVELDWIAVNVHYVNTHTLTTDISPIGGGTTTPAIGTHTYDEGTVVAVSAAAEPGYRFDHWEGDLSGSASPTTVTMSGDLLVTAVFVAQWDLTMAISPGGSGTTTPAIGTHTHDEGTVVAVSAAAEPGYRFDHWEGDLSGSANPTTVTMDAAAAIRAVFLKLAPSISLIQEAVPSAPVSVRETIVYTFTIINTGNVLLTNVLVTVDMSGIISSHSNVLVPGQRTTVTTTHTVQEGDLPGPLVCTAGVTAVTPTARQVSDTASAAVELTSHPAIDLMVETNVSEASLGTSVTYTYTVTNSGDVTLLDLRLRDDLLGTIPLPVETLAPGQSTINEATYVVQKSDFPWPIISFATVSALTATGDAVEGESNDVAVVLFPTEAPRIQVTVEVTPAVVSTGDLLEYRFVVTNVGSNKLMDVELHDSLVGWIELDTTTLVPGQSTATSISHVPQTSAGSGNANSMATATATDTLGVIASDQTEVTVALGPPDTPLEGEGDSEASLAVQPVIITEAGRGGESEAEVCWVRLQALGSIGVDLAGWTLRWRSELAVESGSTHWRSIELAGTLSPVAEPQAVSSQEASPPLSVLLVRNEFDSVSWWVLLDARREGQGASSVDVLIPCDGSVAAELLDESGEVVDAVRSMWFGQEMASPTGPHLTLWIDSTTTDASAAWRTAMGVAACGFGLPPGVRFIGRAILDSSVPDDLARSEMIVPAAYPAGSLIWIGFSLLQMASEAQPRPNVAIYVLNHPTGLAWEDVDAQQAGFVVSSSCDRESYWLGISTLGVLPGRYDLWIACGEARMLFVPILVTIVD